MVVPTWESLCIEAEQAVGSNADLESIFSAEELIEKYDVAISAAAGILAAAVDILLVGIPQKTPEGLSAGKLSDYIRAEFDKKFPEEEMTKLANSKVSKVLMMLRTIDIPP